MSARLGTGREELLNAAARALAEHGYHGMSMRELARATNRAPATLYNYVEHKEDLLYLIQRDAFDEMLVAAKAALEGVTDAEARLHEFVLCHVRFFADRQYLMRVLIHEAAALPPTRRAEIRERKEQYFQIAEDIVAQVANSRDGGEPNPLDVERNTYCLFGMLNWTYGWYEPERHGKPEDLAATIERVAVAGVAAGVSRPRRDRERRSDRAEAHGGAR